MNITQSQSNNAATDKVGQLTYVCVALGVAAFALGIFVFLSHLRIPKEVGTASLALGLVVDMGLIVLYVRPATQKKLQNSSDWIMHNLEVKELYRSMSPSGDEQTTSHTGSVFRYPLDEECMECHDTQEDLVAGFYTSHKIVGNRTDDTVAQGSLGGVLDPNQRVEEPDEIATKDLVAGFHTPLEKESDEIATDVRPATQKKLQNSSDWIMHNLEVKELYRSMSPSGDEQTTSHTGSVFRYPLDEECMECHDTQEDLVAGFYTSHKIVGNRTDDTVAQGSLGGVLDPNQRVEEPDEIATKDLVAGFHTPLEKESDEIATDVRPATQKKLQNSSDWIMHNLEVKELYRSMSPSGDEQTTSHTGSVFRYPLDEECMECHDTQEDLVAGFYTSHKIVGNRTDDTVAQGSLGGVLDPNQRVEEPDEIATKDLVAGFHTPLEKESDEIATDVGPATQEKLQNSMEQLFTQVDRLHILLSKMLIQNQKDNPMWADILTKTQPLLTHLLENICKDEAQSISRLYRSPRGWLERGAYGWDNNIRASVQDFVIHRWRFMAADPKVCMGQDEKVDRFLQHLQNTQPQTLVITYDQVCKMIPREIALLLSEICDGGKDAKWQQKQTLDQFWEQVEQSLTPEKKKQWGNNYLALQHIKPLIVTYDQFLNSIPSEVRQPLQEICNGGKDAQWNVTQTPDRFWKQVQDHYRNVQENRDRAWDECTEYIREHQENAQERIAHIVSMEQPTKIIKTLSQSWQDAPWMVIKLMQEQFWKPVEQLYTNRIQIQGENWNQFVLFKKNVPPGMFTYEEFVKKIPIQMVALLSEICDGGKDEKWKQKQTLDRFWEQVEQSYKKILVDQQQRWKDLQAKIKQYDATRITYARFLKEIGKEIRGERRKPPFEEICDGGKGAEWQAQHTTVGEFLEQVRKHHENVIGAQQKRWETLQRYIEQQYITTPITYDRVCKGIPQEMIVLLSEICDGGKDEKWKQKQTLDRFWEQVEQSYREATPETQNRWDGMAQKIRQPYIKERVKACITNGISVAESVCEAVVRPPQQIKWSLPDLIDINSPEVAACIAPQGKGQPPPPNTYNTGIVQDLLKLQHTVPFGSTHSLILVPKQYAYLFTSTSNDDVSVNWKKELDEYKKNYGIEKKGFQVCWVDGGDIQLVPAKTIRENVNKLPSFFCFATRLRPTHLVDLIGLDPKNLVQRIIEFFEHHIQCLIYSNNLKEDPQHVRPEQGLPERQGSIEDGNFLEQPTQQKFQTSSGLSISNQLQVWKDAIQVACDDTNDQTRSQEKQKYCNMFVGGLIKQFVNLFNQHIWNSTPKTADGEQVQKIYVTQVRPMFQNLRALSQDDSIEVYTTQCIYHVTRGVQGSCDLLDRYLDVRNSDIS